MLDNVLEIINTVVIVLVSLALSFQMIYSLFFIFPKKKYKKANKLHKYGVVIAARNEEKVIEKLIESVRLQNYPQELLDIFVICHNCTDKTEEISRKCGAITYVLNDPCDKRRRKGYALKYGFDNILKDYKDHEAYIMLDADNLLDPDFVSKMNDAFDSGYKCLQGFRSSKNFSQNVVSQVNGTFYLRDSSFNNHARTLIHSTVVVGGTGYLFAREIIEDTGWNAFSLTEDCEFSIQMAIKGYKCVYVPDAIFYDEQPTNFLIAMQRTARMGRGVFQLHFKYGPKLLFKFFTTFKFKFLDLFFNTLFAPVSVLCILWFPAYYTYLPVKMLIENNADMLPAYLQMVGFGILGLIGPITIQNIIVYLLNRKKLPGLTVWKATKGILFFLIYNMSCSLAMTIGIFNPFLVWKQIEHNNSISIDDIKVSK